MKRRRARQAAVTVCLTPRLMTFKWIISWSPCKQIINGAQANVWRLRCWTTPWQVPELVSCVWCGQYFTLANARQFYSYVKG